MKSLSSEGLCTRILAQICKTNDVFSHDGHQTIWTNLIAETLNDCWIKLLVQIIFWRSSRILVVNGGWWRDDNIKGKGKK